MFANDVSCCLLLRSKEKIIPTKAAYSSTRIHSITSATIIRSRLLFLLYQVILIVPFRPGCVASFSPTYLKENSRSIVSQKANTRKRILFKRSSRTIFGGQWERNMATTNVEHKADNEMIPSLEIFQNVLAVAVDASRAAGAIIREYAGGAQVSERKANSRDLLTLVDPLCEKTIKEKVLETFPHHEFLGEEMVAPGADASKAALNLALNNSKTDWLWIVDPIDGTTNFVHGIPLCMPSVAVAYHGRVVVGVIYDPHRDELFSAIRGQGAYLNQDRLIKVGLQDSIGDAVVAMGSPPGIESLQMSLKGVAALMPKVRTIRS